MPGVDWSPQDSADDCAQVPSPVFIYCKIQEMGDPAGLHGEEQEVKDIKTSSRFGLLHPPDFWPLPSEEKQVGNEMMSCGTHKIL